FDPFFSTKKTGTGLGLSAVYGILKSHGAMVRVDSEPDIGTCFTIHFQATGQKVQALGDGARVAPTRGGTETILVADDEEAIRMVSTDILRTLGYRVISAADGEEAVSIFQERPRAIDLVILDVDMPNLNGRAAARVMQLARPDIKVLFASGYSDANQRKALRDEGFDQFISKPFTMFDLQSAVRQILDDGKDSE
ncbi:MAG: response regulator, partial [Candidatus Sumerlaeota bacterium]